MNFDESVKEHISSRLQVEFLLDQIRYGLLRDIIEECFLLETSRDSTDSDKAERILAALFAILVRGFDFRLFLAYLPESEKTKFLTSLLYHIYYLNLTLEHLISSETLFFYLLKTLAQEASIACVASIYKSLPIAKRLRFLGFCLKNFDEGAYRILIFAECTDTKDIQKLLGLINKKILSLDVTSDWLEAADDESNVGDFLLSCEEKTRKSIKLIQSHLSCSEHEVAHFCSIFGLYDHQVPKEAWDLHEYSRLDEKLVQCTDDTHKAFRKAILDHIHALSTDIDAYVKGMNLITYALPTTGKDLSLYAWLPSVSASIEGFCNELKIPNTIPIFVFDQSSIELFEKNAQFIKSVNKNCIHLDTASILTLAKLLHIDKLLETDSEGHFGYGGARNTIFLLTPLLRYYLKESNNTPLMQYVTSLPQKKLQDDFKSVVLDETAAPCIIHMGDDDVHVPYSTAFSDALFAWRHQDEYFCRFGWVKGRRTTWTETSFNLKYVLENTQVILLQHNWQDEPFRHGMAGLLSKPKLCLNVPFGQEEAYLLAMDEYLFDMRHPMLHLSGYRFPKSTIPTNRFSGLASFLRGHYRYSVGSMLVSDLLDPLDAYNRCSLPWNKVKENFTSLHNAIDYIIKPETIKKMQSVFAINIENLEKGLQNYEQNKLKESNLAIFHLSVLEIQDIESILQEYSRFPKEVSELQLLFTDLASDAVHFKRALAGTDTGYPSSKYPITHALQLMQHVINQATFQKILSKIV